MKVAPDFLLDEYFPNLRAIAIHLERRAPTVALSVKTFPFWEKGVLYPVVSDGRLSGIYGFRPRDVVAIEGSSKMTHIERFRVLRATI